MARSPMFRLLRRALQRARQGAAPPAAPVDGPSRRSFLGATAGALALAPLAMACGDDGTATPRTRVAIVGGGIAGLHCAYRLLGTAALDVTIYEGSGRVGGRMSTARGVLAGGQLVELGGELIDTGHVTMRALAEEFGLALDDLAAVDTDVTAEVFHFDGQVVPEADLVAAFTPLAALMASTVSTAEADDAEFARVDAMSIPEWLEQEAGLASDALIRRILEVAYLEEFGLPASAQSIFNLLYLIDYDTPDPFRVFGDSDERFHTHLGNDAITTALAEAITAARADAIALEHRLVKVVQGDDGAFALTFALADDSLVEVACDHVVFALPFTTLREVDLSAAGLSADKLDMITTLGYGTNAKLMMQFASRPWRDPGGFGGGAITDVGDLQSTWETSRGQDGAHGIITNFVGGERGVALGDGTAEDRAAEVLPWLEQVFPGTSAAYLAGSAIRMHWPSQPLTRGSYASYLVGQWAFWGTEGQREGNAHFCGEHCSLESQGYMEGGAETGALVAAEILDDLGAAPSARHAALLDHLLALPHPCFQRGGDVRQRRQARRRARRALPR